MQFGHQNCHKPSIHALRNMGSMYEKIGKAANEFEVSFAEVVRECIDRELDKLIDREKKRKQSQQNLSEHR